MNNNEYYISIGGSEVFLTRAAIYDNEKQELPFSYSISDVHTLKFNSVKNAVKCIDKYKDKIKQSLTPYIIWPVKLVPAKVSEIHYFSKNAVEI